MGNKFGSNCASHSTYGNNLRDDMIQFQIDNELGYKLQMVRDPDNENIITFTLLSKSGTNLGYGTFNLGGNTSLNTVVLDQTNKRMRFILENKTEIDCSLDSLYTLIATKQEQLVSGTNIKTINGNDILGSGDVTITLDDLLTVARKTAIDSGITSELVGKLNDIAEGATKVESSTTNGNIKINGQETNVYNDEALTNRVGAIEGDYLKNADKVELNTSIKTNADNIKTNADNIAFANTSISNEVIRATNAESTLSGRIDEKVSKETGKGLSTVDFTDTNYKHITVTSGAVTDGTNTFAQYDDTTVRTLIGNNTTNIEANATAISNETTRATTAETSLSNRIESLEGRGRFLSGWNCATGKPTSEPTSLPYAYKAGDYYIVETIGEINYMPTGSSYNGYASTAIDTRELGVGDYYTYDGTTWLLIKNTTKDISFANISGEPTDNTNLATALNDKVSKEDGKGLSTNDFTNDYKSQVEANTNKVSNVQSDWNATEGLSVVLNKPTLSDVATSGSYSDLIDKPEIPEAQVQTDWNATSGLGVLSNKSSMASTSVLYDETNNNFKLPDTWVTYLTKQTFNVPTITLNASNSTRSFEYGANVSSSFTHYETYVDNINGTLTLYKNNSAVESDIAKTTSSASLSTTLSEDILSTISYQLKCVDTLGTTRTSSTISFSCYKPVFYGCDTNESISSVDGLTKKSSSSFGTISFTSTAGQYAYFVTSGTISSIKSGGFDVPFTKQGATISVDFNGHALSYNVYRTTSSLDAGSNTMVIA